MKLHAYFTLIMALLLTGACSEQPPQDQVSRETATPGEVNSASVLSVAADVNMQRLQSADEHPGQWMTYGRTYDEQRYSPLDSITTENAAQLGLAWYADLDSNLQQQATPLYIDGVIYYSIPWASVYAFDAKTGELLWKYDPGTPKEWAAKICCGIVNRGIAAWNGKIYVGSIDGYLIAIDAKSGAEVWRSLTFDQDDRYTITSAPRIAEGKVFIGNSGSEFGVRGYLGAYDAETGAPLWRFYTVPGNPAEGFENEQMRMAAETWGGEWWKVGGGGTVWDAIVYDEENKLVIFGTGNGTPWYQGHRDPTGGDNLFIASIIAVHAETGEYSWHYQTSPGDTWDYDSVSPMTLADLTIGGVERRVVMQPCKNGFMYVLDVATGELLKADPFTVVNWADGVDLETGRPNVRQEALYTSDRAYLLAPGYQGGHGWHANAFDPNTGLLYIATQSAYAVVKGSETFEYNPDGANLALDFSATGPYYEANPDAPRGFVGYVQAWDPVTGKTVWKGDENGGPTGGVLVTAGGLVFQGGGAGNEFRAYNAMTGEKLWNMDVQTASLAPPISFELDGEQYITVSVGGNSAEDYFAPNYSRLLVFRLGADGELPPVTSYTPRPLDPPQLTADAQTVSAGQAHYDRHCAICHGANGTTRRSSFPNLLVSPFLHSQEAFDQVVLQGVRTEMGMGAFADRLQPDESATIRAYLVSRAQEELQAQDPAPAAMEAVEEDAHEELEE